MKKIIAIAMFFLVATSCATSGRVCGGSGGKRCVQKTSKVTTYTITLFKA